MTLTTARLLLAPCLVLALVAGCDSSEPEQSDAGTQYDAAITCEQTSPGGNSDTCDWEWTCSDYSGVTPELAMHCELVAGTDFSCQCRQAGALTATISMTDGCSSVANGCEAANAACSFSRAIVCP
jgi:hypothetical protein